MSSDEDFSLMDTSQPSEDTLEGIKALIDNCKKKYNVLVQEQKELAASRDEQRETAQQFKQRTEKLIKEMKVDEQTCKMRIENELARVGALKQEESELLEEILKVEAALKEEEATHDILEEQANALNFVPEKKLVFTGVTDNVADKGKFEMKSHIVYPMDGGTALVTFEEEDVAQNILCIKKHQVDLGEECRIAVKARPVQLMLPSRVEIHSEVCPQRILISNLPKMDTDTMLNKLEIHFSKSRHKGGEVEHCEMLEDSGTVVLTFVEKHIAKHLTDAEYHEVQLHKTKHKVRVTPFLNGKITNLEVSIYQEAGVDKTKMTACPRTVLLTGIPDVMERDTLQDLLEIHFQKNSNGGGEIEAFLYNPLGQLTYALFKEN